MDRINVITRCVKLGNLRKIEESLRGIPVRWWVLFDVNSVDQVDTDILYWLGNLGFSEIRFFKSDPKTHGSDMINLVLPEIPDDEWIYVLDDDNLMHPDFWNRISDVKTDRQIICVSQFVGGTDFSGVEIREACPENMKVGGVDSAQLVIRKGSVGTFPESYFFDGMFVERVLGEFPDGILYVNEVLSYYNRISPTVDYSLPRILVVGDSGESEIRSDERIHESSALKVVRTKKGSVVSKISEMDPDCILTVGEKWEDFPEISGLPYDYRKRWLHFGDISDSVGESAYRCSMNYILDPFYGENPLISFFTPIFNTGNKLMRTYESVKSQTYTNWEWVLVDDSSDGGKTLKIARRIAETDPRVKVYDFGNKTGGVIGESKYRAASMCSGKYLMELDHDDCLTRDAGYWMVEAFKKYPDAKFVYSDCAEISTNGQSMTYGDGFSFGYGSYRDEVYDGVVYKVMNTSNINPKTIRHIVGVPNHFRAWDRLFYHSVGGHNRRLTIADDYELIVRTFLNTRMVRIPKLLYFQYYHSSNTQDQTRSDIQRRVRTISGYYNERIKSRFEELGKTDWAYQGNPTNPTWVGSRFGDGENFVNYVFRENTVVYSPVSEVSLQYVV
jgi:glycosyltransferase involved in cell wall biosynthesis